jgi:ERCC4-type nuclease
MTSLFDIVVDTRERDLPKALEAAGCTGLTVKPLDIGDIEVWIQGKRTLVVERKSLSDLAASVKDGRYAEQKARMLASGVNHDIIVMYVVEVGSFASAFAFDERMKQGIGGLPAATLQSCVVSMLMDARVAMTRDVADTAAFVLRAAKRLMKHQGAASYAHCAAVASVVSSKKRENLDPAACFRHQMVQLPGVSVKLARVLCDKFGSMSQLYSQLTPMAPSERVAAFAALPLIGPKKAAQLEAFMFCSPDHAQRGAPLPLACPGM